LIYAYTCTLPHFLLRTNTVKPAHKDHSREPENVALMSSCTSCTGKNYMHYSLKGKIWLPW